MTLCQTRHLGILLLSLVLLSSTAAAGSVVIQDGQVNASSSVNAGNALFVNSANGYVGIGTTSASRPLHVAATQDANIRLQDTAGSAPAAYIEFYNDTTRWGYVGLGGHDDKMVLGTTAEKNLSFYTNNSSKMVITAGGHVGVGTSSPEANLHLYSSSTSNATSDLTAIIERDDTLYAGHQLTIRGKTDPNKRLYVGYQTTGNYGGIQAYQETVGAKPLVLQGSGGNVGIGTTAPGGKLDVHYAETQAMTATWHYGTLVLSDESEYNSSYEPGITFYRHRDAIGNNILAAGISAYGYSTPDVGLKIYTSSSLNTLSEKMRVTSAGYVGIGTNSPASKLHVADGEMQTGTSNASCTSAKAGAIRWTGGGFWGCNGTNWGYMSLNEQASATGGTVTDIAGYRVHTFTSNGTFTITSGTGPFELLIVGGGGGGSYGNPGAWGGGMGGSGGVLMGTLTDLSGSYSVVVGAGGTGGAPAGTKGGNSAFGSYTAYGGGYGVNFAYGGSGYSGGAGGSGGGCGQGGCSGGASTQTSQPPLIGYGNAGELFGGGGAGGAAQSYSGGSGIYSLISGQSVYYAPGGMQYEASYIGQGGCGYLSTSGCNGIAGIVIIRYPIAQ